MAKHVNGIGGARILDGQQIARQVRAEVAAGVAALAAVGVTPGLAVVLVGDDPASAVYVRMKARACREAGMNDRTLNLPADVSADELFGVIDGLNADPGIHGILVQLPLPPHLDARSLLERVRPSKDVDGFHPVNVGRSFVGDPRGFVPATPAGILHLLREGGVETRGREAVVVGRSLIVGKPLASLLMAPGRDATVTLCHRHTPDLAAQTRRADILVSATGVPGLIGADMVKPGAAVIDVGTIRVDDAAQPQGYRITGDVQFEPVREVAGLLTPVPGGVGPMTIAMLLRNTLLAARRAARRARRAGSDA